MNFTTIDNKGTCEGFAILKSVEVKQTTKGTDYLDMTLADKNDEVNAKYWDYCGESFEASELVKVRGVFSTYNDARQFKVERIRKVTEEDVVRIEDYVPSACLPGEMMFSEICSVVSSFENAELQTLVFRFLQENKDRLLYWPAAKSNHHAIRGGLLMHTLSILRIAESVCNVYRFVNRDLLYTGVILHDIAKLEELNASKIGIAGEYTDRGMLLGHLVGGAMMVDRIGREIGTSEETLTLVEHMLVSHHGQPEWGAAKVPMFVEAEILSQLDVLDARIYEMKTAVDDADKGKFSSPQRALGGRSVYNHILSPEEKDINLFL